MWARVCSVRHPLCVRPEPATPDRVALDALAAADSAWDGLFDALALPPPDGVLGEAWDVYLLDGVQDGSRAEPVQRDPIARFDRASSFGLVDRSTPSGCPLRLAVARALAQGSLWRAAPATDRGSALAETEMLARLVTPCASRASDDAAAELQDHPERAVVDPSSPAFDRGAYLFFDWLDATFAASPGALVPALWALAATRTPPGAWRWAASPTGFDVLRVSLAGALSTGSDLGDVMLKFAVDRALATPPVRLAWHLPWPDHARRLASPVPVAPTGASYVLVDHAGAPPGASLVVQAQWEAFGRMRWAVVKLDAAGRPLAVVPVGSPRLAKDAAITVDLLDGTDRLLIVGANVGSTEHGFDPDQGGWEPHGWLLTVRGE